MPMTFFGTKRSSNHRSKSTVALLLSMLRSSRLSRHALAKTVNTFEPKFKNFSSFTFRRSFVLRNTPIADVLKTSANTNISKPTISTPRGRIRPNTVENPSCVHKGSLRKKQNKPSSTSAQYSQILYSVCGHVPRHASQASTTVQQKYTS